MLSNKSFINSRPHNNITKLRDEKYGKIRMESHYQERMY